MGITGLLLARDTVELGRSLLVVDGQRLTSVAEMHPQDLKLLGMSQITALGLVKLGLKAADTGARNDIIGKLIAAIEAEKAGAK